MPASVVNNLGMPGTLSCSEEKVLRGSMCDFGFPDLRAEFLLFASFTGLRSGTILKIGFRNIAGELGVVLNREFEMIVGVRFCLLQVPCAVERVQRVGRHELVCVVPPTSLAVQTPEWLVCGGALCGIAQFGMFLCLLSLCAFQYPPCDSGVPLSLVLNFRENFDTMCPVWMSGSGWTRRRV